MLEWLKHINKEYPEFWKTYLSKFDKKPNRYVVFKIETTGSTPTKDVILTFGAVSIINESIIIGDNFEVVLLQYIYLHDNGLPNDFIIESKFTKLAPPQALQAFVEYIGNSILVGHNTQHDIDFINVALEKMECGRLKNEAIDVEIMHQKLIEDSEISFTLEELCNIYPIPIPDRKTSSDDAYLIAQLFLKLKKKLGFK
jgi:DNA polymerase III subunit epsilon